MRRPLSVLAVLVAGAALASPPLTAQDRFGAALAQDDGAVFVLKPGTGRGSAALFVYTAGPGGWSLDGRLPAAAPEAVGEPMSASLSAAPGLVAAGSADAAGRWSAHLYRPAPDGGWRAEGRAPLGDVPAVEPSGEVTLAGLFRVASPPARLAALFDAGRAMAVVETASAPGGVLRVLARAGAGWREVASFALDRSATGEPDFLSPGGPPPSAPAVSGDRIAVGLPGAEGGGAVLLFERVGGTWSRAATVASPGAVPGGAAPNAAADAPTDAAADGGESLRGFGTAVALDGDELLVGAPGGRAVSVFGRDPAGSWTERARIAGRDAGFGWALAPSGDALWVGAPAADEGRGAVVGHRRAADGGWTTGHRLDGGLAPGAAFGAALSAAPGRLLVGAPGADGGQGRVAVYEFAGGAPGEPAWLTPALGLDAVVGGEVRCDDGRAAGFECGGVDLLAYLPLQALGAGPGERVSDLWGWTDPVTGREYALVGRTAGLAVVDVTDPSAPALLGLMPGNPSGARDIKVYRDHAFMTGDGAGDHGLLVLDLTRIRELSPGGEPAVLEPDARYGEIASAHNLVLNEETGFAYPVGASGGGRTCGGGLHMVDVREPEAPVFAGCYTDTEGLIWQGRTHDAQCVVYRGPDAEYRGREICFASNETALRIVDVTDKDAPEPLAAAPYPQIAYTHQGWLTEDHRYFFLDDEVDELAGLTDRTRTLVWDVMELEDPVLVGEYFGPDGATDHNLFIRGDRMYQANYQAGLRVVDVSDPTRPVEVGFFDTTPYPGNPPGFAGGAWSAFPFFESGTVIVSSMNEGLFVLRPRRPLVP